MTQCHFVGVQEQEEGSAAARSFPCRATVTSSHLKNAHISCNISLADATLSCFLRALELAANDASSRYGRDIPAGLKLDLQCEAPASVEILAGQSYGLAVYVICLAELLGVSTIPAMRVSGVLRSGGELSPVKHLFEKSQAGHMPLVCPSGSSLSAAHVWPVADRHSAFMACVGLTGVETLLRVPNAPNRAMDLVESAMGAFNSAFFPNGLALLLKRLRDSQPALAKAFEIFPDRWAWCCLKGSHRVPEEHHAQLCELLDFSAAYTEAWENPAQQQQLIADVMNGLANAAQVDPEGATVALTAFMTVTRTLLNWAQVLQDSAQVRSYLLGLQKAIVDSANAAGVVDRLKPAWGRLQRHLTVLMEVKSTLQNPHLYATVIGRGEKPALRVIMEYSGGDFIGMQVHTPRHPQFSPDAVYRPVALFDDCLGLPVAWRRRDISADDSAFRALQNGAAVMALFGEDNEFVFPPFIKNGMETRILWNGRTGTWPPSIDTLHLAGVLGDVGIYGRNQHYDRILDLGCGTGVHGLLLSNNADVRQVDLMDAEIGPRLTAASNVMLNHEPVSDTDVIGLFDDASIRCFKRCRFRFLDGWAQELLGDQDPYDLLVATPPYVPFMDVLDDEAIWTATAGTGLIRFVVKNASRLARKTVLQFSEMATPEVEDVLTGLSPVASHIVGFRIPPLANYFDSGNHEKDEKGQQWLSLVRPYLIDTEESDYGGPPHHGFKYMHRVNTYIIGEP